MKTSGSLFPGLCRSFVLALCVGAAPAILTVPPGVVRAEAMSDAAFVELCREGTTEQVRKALKDGANPNARETKDTGWTALMLAVERKDAALVQALLSAGADVNATNRAPADFKPEGTPEDPVFGVTPLMVAAENGDLSLVRVLLAAGAKVNARNDEGGTALMDAAGRSAAVVRALLEAGADVNARVLHHGSDEFGMTALVTAAMQGEAEAVAVLLAAGADRSVSGRGMTALEWAKHNRDSAHSSPQEKAAAERIIRLLEDGGGKKPAPARAANTETSRVRAAAERLRTGEDVSPEAAAAANSLGVWHEKGSHGLRRDMREAARWYALAAEHGDALAMHNLGDLYRQGKGVRQDSREAFRWYGKAADAGHAVGLEDMADCYLKGVGVAQNRGEAVRLYREAARQGRKSAAQKLREMGE